MPDPTVQKEITLCAAWHAGAFGDTFQTTAGVSIRIVHRGMWSHGLGPDFKDAMILVAGRELRAGDIEIHLRTRGWSDHGHNLDPAYDHVVLHVVAEHDCTESRRHDGALVPVVEVGFLESHLSSPLADRDWSRVGGAVCAAEGVRQNPERIRAALESLGDLRMAQRSARVEAQLPTTTPAEVLWEEVFDGLGFSRNRAPMRRVAAALRIAALEELLPALPGQHRLAATQGLLLGAAGFLPLTPSDASLGALSPPEVTALESGWSRYGSPWAGETIPATAWDLARTRPANHPVPRLLAAAALAVNCLGRGGFYAAMQELVGNDGDLGDELRRLTSTPSHPGIGRDRALDILASSIIPGLLAIATHTEHEQLLEMVARQWEELPAATPNSVTKRAKTQVAGRASLGKIGARASQGLIQLDTTLCQTRRCFECPIAALELAVNG